MTETKPREVPGRPLVVGAMCVDLKGRPHHALLPSTSNMGVLERRPGGVAFNIAANLARLGLDPVFLSAVGRDVDGDYLLGQCERASVDAGRVRRVAEGATPVYLAVLDDRGDLAVAVAAMDLCDHMTGDVLGLDEALAADPPLVLADANLPASTLRHLALMCDQRGIPLWVEPTAADKCARLHSCLGSITYLSPNQEELEILVGRPLDDDGALREGARFLVRQGVEHVFVTLGPRGVLWVSEGRDQWHPSVSVPVVDVTGAGDAFVSGVAWALVLGHPVEDAIECGVAASLLAIQVADSAPRGLEPGLLLETRRRFLGESLAERIHTPPAAGPPPHGGVAPIG